MKKCLMPLPKVAIQLLLLVTIFMAFFSAVYAHKCYREVTTTQPLQVAVCGPNDIGCGDAFKCLEPDGTRTGLVRGCASPDYCKTILKKGFTMNDFCNDCKYCSGDLCNGEGLTNAQKQAVDGGGIGSEEEKVTPAPKPESGSVEQIPTLEPKPAGSGEEKPEPSTDGSTGIVGSPNMGISIAMAFLLLGVGLFKVLML